ADRLVKSARNVSVYRTISMVCIGDYGRALVRVGKVLPQRSIPGRHKRATLWNSRASGHIRQLNLPRHTPELAVSVSNKLVVFGDFNAGSVIPDELVAAGSDEVVESVFTAVLRRLKLGLHPS